MKVFGTRIHFLFALLKAQLVGFRTLTTDLDFTVLAPNEVSGEGATLRALIKYVGIGLRRPIVVDKLYCFLFN
jgi:hypothetical protein